MNIRGTSYRSWVSRYSLILVLFAISLADLIQLFGKKEYGIMLFLHIMVQNLLMLLLYFLYRQKERYTKNLMENEQRYQSLFLYNNAGIYVINMDGTLNSVSPALSASLGYAEDEIIGRPFGALFAPPDATLLQQSFQGIVSGEIVTSSRKIKIRHKQGNYLVFDLSSVALRVKDKIQGVIGFARDITEFERVQEELSQMQTHVNNIFESIDIVLWSRDVATDRVTMLSPACVKLFGYTPDQYLANPGLWNEQVYEMDREAVNQRTVRILAGDLQANTMEYRIVHQNGEIRWMESRMFPVMNKRREITDLNGVILDITDKKRVEENQRMDLNLARRVQKSVLSQPFHTPSFAISARHIPSRQLGGDMYVWHQIDAYRYGVLIMDVMGEGVSSSLICMSLHALLKGIIVACVDPEDVITELNNHMNRLFSDNITFTHFYFTAIYTVVDLKAKRLDYINAGHPSGLVMEESGAIHELSSTCIPIGLMPDMTVKKQSVPFQGNTRILLYTDGLIEVPGKLLREQIDWVIREMRNTRMMPMSFFLEKLLSLSAGNTNENPDDVCMICMDIAAESHAEEG
ncbi:SpoIIE family protein phosphatase [Paenibacillus sp. NFR01]|uniref:SpoIIE family protein phosphatase n=1 Tax=Paenibacillus sp. NFR01 TaxID=1566279 RepID=UPI0008BEB87F|nr:SpoIIE family protein phosphatase [Paenibacillus sp. NFR01]SEU23584.1 PAS domain S-box-containing protein [Paenibacillus sp. NFR01]